MNAPALAKKNEAPKVIEGLSFADYLKIDAVHSSALKNILVSPRFYKARKDRPMKDNDDLALGRAGHTAIFEPALLQRDYAVWDKSLGKRDKRTELYSNFLDLHAGKSILTNEQMDDALKMRDAVFEHPIVGPRLRRKGQSELTLVWTHARTGLRCKARIDRLVDGEIMDELKTCVDPSEEAFWRIAKRLKYPVQFSFYRDGVIECLGFAPQVRCIAVQKKDPWDVVSHIVTTETLMAGAEKVELAMDTLAECTASGIWPGQAWDREPELRISEMDLGETTDVTFDGEEI